MIIDGQKLQQNVEHSCDVAIIGSGAGGSVLAKELSEAGFSVILIDEGGHHPTSSHRDLPFQAIKRLYQNHGMTSTIGRPAVPLPLGRALGGTTVINSGTCFRTPEKIFKHWQQHFGLKNLNIETFTPYFERVEKNIHASPCQFDTMGALIFSSTSF